MEELLGKTIVTFFEECRKRYFDHETAIYQGAGQKNDFDFIKIFNETAQKDEIIEQISLLVNDKSFREFVLEQVRREKKEEISKRTRERLMAENDYEFAYCENSIIKTKEYLSVLDWDWYVENNCRSLCDFLPYLKDWKWVLLSNLFEYYKKCQYGKFLDYYKGCPLETYLNSKEVEGRIDDHYHLLKLDSDWALKDCKPPRVYIPQLNTHILLRHIPSDLLMLIARWRKENVFELSVRPDYNICGDGITEIGCVFEEKDFGVSYSGSLTTIDRISKYYDRDWVNDWLIVQQDEKGITFEEILEEGPHDQDDFVTQVVHLQYIEAEGKEYITHIDHEYVFYSENGIEAKRNSLKSKGEARTRYKTFKIDNAKIPYTTETSENVLYKVLMAYFTKSDLVDEFFRLQENDSK